MTGQQLSRDLSGLHARVVMFGLLELHRPVVRAEDTLPKGEGSMRRYFCGEAPELDGDMGAHLLLFGDAGFIRGSKSIVLLRVAPQAIISRVVFD